MQRKDWAARVDGLVVFRGLLQSEPLASLRAALAADAAGLTGAVAAFESALFTQGTNWTEVLLDAVLEDENLCLRTGFGQLLLSLFLQLEQGIICHFNLFQFLSTSGEIGQHLLDRGTILLFQAVELIQAALYRVQFTGGKIEAAAQIP